MVQTSHLNDDLITTDRSDWVNVSGGLSKPMKERSRAYLGNRGALRYTTDKRVAFNQVIFKLACLQKRLGFATTPDGGVFPAL